MAQITGRGFRPVLANRPFRLLWVAQLLALVAQHAITFVQLVLVEKLTGSTVHLGLVILAFSLPGVLLSPIAGVVVDRLPRKWIMVGSNLVRVFFALGYILILQMPAGAWQLLAIYFITLLTSTVAQFFAPAQGATIPTLVGEQHLLAANSLFTLTLIMSQVLGLVVLGPLAISLLQIEGGFALIAAMYLGATLLLTRLPRDIPLGHGDTSAASIWQALWTDLREALRFLSGHRRLQANLVQLLTISTIIILLAMLAPGYAARVLGMEPENAIIVFAPAGLGMLLATAATGRWGHVLRRIGFHHLGLALGGLAFAGLGWVSLDYHHLMQPLLAVYPSAAFSLTTVTMILGLIIGVSLAIVNILAQTSVQQETPSEMRGRVLSLQFMTINLLGIPPLLGFGGLADAIGIPRVMVIIGLVTVAMGGVSLLVIRLPVSRPR
jgi:MFS family permease